LKQISVESTGSVSFYSNQNFLLNNQWLHNLDPAANKQYCFDPIHSFSSNISQLHSSETQTATIFNLLKSTNYAKTFRPDKR
jgi:hypothetical protein